jgi:hypothetical protein
LTTNHDIIFIVAAFSICWVVISLIDTLESKKRLRAKKETWGKLNEISERLKVEKDLKVWESLGNSNQKKENIK